MTFDLVFLFIMLIFVIGVLLLFYDRIYPAMVVLGGALENTEPTVIVDGGTHKGVVYIEDKAKFVFDGHNLIHGLSGKSAISIEEFDKNLKHISDIIGKALPKKDLHIVLKNPGEKLTEIFNQKYEEMHSKPSKKSDKKKKPAISKEEKIPYFKQLVETSKLYPKITYHLAYGKEPEGHSELKHYLRGRDDILSIYLSRPDGYIISMDAFRDFKDFPKVKPFKHFSVKSGTVLPKEDIKPSIILEGIRSPNLGNLLKYRFVDKKELKKLGIKNGTVFVDDSIHRFSCLYIDKS
jgi:hypothetical protein